MTVDGAPAHLGQKVDPETAWVEVDGVALPIKPDLVFYLLYKPVGVISTTDDPQQRQTVIDLVPGDTRVYPVGRLDADRHHEDVPGGGRRLDRREGAVTPHQRR